MNKENIKNLNPPSELHQFDLNLIPEFDTIWVVSETNFIYNINTYGLNIKSYNFSLNGESLYLSSNSFVIQPFFYTKGFYTLTLDITTNSGTGSISDLLGVEGYKVEKKWILYIDDDPVVALSHSVTKEGFLKITWPKLPLINFSRYELSGSINSMHVSKTIKDIDSTSYIDSTYIGGEASFGITYYFKPGNNFENFIGQLELEDSVPKLRFEDIGVDSLRIFWKKSLFKCKYKLVRVDISPDSTILKSSIDTSCIIVSPSFGTNAEYILYTSPFHLNTTNTWYTKYDIKYHALGNYIAGNWPDFGYNHLDKVLYTNTYDDMECYDIFSMNKIRSVRITDLIYEGIYSCPTNSTKVATLSSANIYVFTNKELQNPVTIPYDSRTKDIDCIYITDNDVIAINYPNKYDLISIAEKKVIATINIDDYPVYSRWACISTSKDGKYACFVTRNGINLYNIENIAAINKVYTDNRSYRSVIFNTNDPNQVLLTFTNDNILEVRNVWDFNLVKLINLPSNAQVLRNIDPENGYLLLTDYIYLYVLDMATSNIVFKVRCSASESKPQLYGNRLFSKCGYTLDISKYLTK